MTLYVTGWLLSVAVVEEQYFCVFLCYIQNSFTSSGYTHDLSDSTPYNGCLTLPYPVCGETHGRSHAGELVPA